MELANLPSSSEIIEHSEEIVEERVQQSEEMVEEGVHQSEEMVEEGVHHNEEITEMKIINEEIQNQPPVDSNTRSQLRTFWSQDRLSYYLSHDQKWLGYALRMISASVGFAVLMLPYALSNLTWSFGVVIMILSWMASLCTLRMLVVMHEGGPTRLNSYMEIAQHAFGEGYLLKAVGVQQFMVRAGTNIIHMVVAGQSLQMFVHLVICSNCNFERLSVCIAIFGSLQLLLSLVPNIFSKPKVKLTAFLLILSYCIIILTAMGQIAFAFSGQTDAPEIQKEIFSTLRRSRGPMWKAVLASYLVGAAIYFPVAIIGFWRFGNRVNSNVILSLQGPVWLLAIANMSVVLQLAISYQIKARPAFDQIETLVGDPHWLMRYLFRILYSAVILLLGITLPFAKGYVAVVGGIANTSIIYLFPCLMWVYIYKSGPSPSKFAWFFKWICIPISAILIIVSTVGGLFDVKNEAREFKFFH